MRLEEEAKLAGTLSDNGIQVTEDLSLCATRKEELGGINFFNHSCNPNAGISGPIFLVPLRKIKAGEEITFDYAMTLFKSKNVSAYRMKCLCNNKNCRGVITDNDWKNPVLQKKYDGYFQWFIQEKINKKRKL